MKDKQGGSKPNEKDFCITRFYYNVRMYASFSAIWVSAAQLADGTYDINYVIQKRKMIQLQWQMIILKTKAN